MLVKNRRLVALWNLQCFLHFPGIRIQPSNPSNLRCVGDYTILRELELCIFVSSSLVERWTFFRRALDWAWNSQASKRAWIKWNDQIIILNLNQPPEIERLPLVLFHRKLLVIIQPLSASDDERSTMNIVNEMMDNIRLSHKLFALHM